MYKEYLQRNKKKLNIKVLQFFMTNYLKYQLKVKFVFNNKTLL